MDQYLRGATRLHGYLVDNHWDGRALRGPDPGIRFNYRIGRFVKSYLPGFGWGDDYCYLQAQGYWTLGNWRLFRRTRDKRYRELAMRCTAFMLSRQRADGAWDYPNPEWQGRVATGEGVWASLGLLETYRQTGDPSSLAGALRWHQYLMHAIGFQRIGDELAVNYFGGRSGVRVSNASADVLRFLAELAEATADGAYRGPCAGLLAFLRGAQTSGGELPYAVRGTTSARSRPHFQCYQYNAFQCLGLMRYYELTRDGATVPLIRGVLGFLGGGLAEDGHARFACGDRHRRVTYHAAALGAAFAKAGQVGLEGYDDLARRAYCHVLREQQPDGGFAYSRGDYRLLSDRRSYPRYLAMIMDHLLLPGAAADAGLPRVA